ncbi:MAG: hypothetical protein J6W56_12185 [Prevotella sp.]|nr:hypothetical protein [Prevotella sp.]
MKKSIFSFAVLAVSICMMACGNKSANNAGGADSTEVATEAEQTLPELKTSYIQKDFTISAPEGWNTTPNRDEKQEGIMLFKGEMENIMSIPLVMIEVGQLEEGKSFEDGLKEVEAEAKAKPIPDVTIDGKTFKGFEMTEGDMKGIIMVREEAGKTISVTITNTKADDPEVLAILKSLKLK